MKGIDIKYFDLAELLIVLIEEESIYDEIPYVKLPQTIINKTAKALRNAFESGEEVPDEEGRLYNIYLVEKYGGLIEAYLDKKLEKIQKDRI